MGDGSPTESSPWLPPCLVALYYCYRRVNCRFDGGRRLPWCLHSASGRKLHLNLGGRSDNLLGGYRSDNTTKPCMFEGVDVPEEPSPISERVVQHVASTTGRDPLELPILHDIVDPDALDTLVEGMSDGQVSFTYAGQEITITSDGEITLEEASSVRPSQKAEVSAN